MREDPRNPQRAEEIIAGDPAARVDPMVVRPRMRTGSGAPQGRAATAPADIEQNVNVITPRDRVRWGPVIAGLLAAITVFVLLTILGAAIGATTLQANGGTANANTDQYGMAAGIWGAASAVIAFFIGGFIAAKTAAVGGVGSGWINGVTVFLAGFFLIVWLTSQGGANLFGALGTNLNDIRNLVTNTYNDPTARAAALDNAKNGLWWSLVSIVVGIVAAGLGGLVGHRDERDVWHGDVGTRA